MAKEFKFDNASLGMFACTGTDGSIDVDATVNKFRAQFAEFATSYKANESELAVHLNKVFDSQPKGAYRPSSWLIAKVAESMGVEYDGWTVVKDRLQAFLDANSSKKADGTRMFHVKHGSGVARMKDLVPSE